MIVQAANDATVLLAEAVGGSVENFVAMMNRQAQAFGLKVSQFRNPEGLPAPGHVSTVRELGIIATRLLQDFPGEVKFLDQRIHLQQDHAAEPPQRLLWRDPSVDGLEDRLHRCGWLLPDRHRQARPAQRAAPAAERRRRGPSKESRAVESQEAAELGLQAAGMRSRSTMPARSSPRPRSGRARPPLQIGTQVPVSVAVPRGGCPGQTQWSHRSADRAAQPGPAGRHAEGAVGHARAGRGAGHRARAGRSGRHVQARLGPAAPVAALKQGEPGCTPRPSFPPEQSLIRVSCAFPIQGHGPACRGLRGRDRAVALQFGQALPAATIRAPPQRQRATAPWPDDHHQRHQPRAARRALPHADRIRWSEMVI